MKGFGIGLVVAGWLMAGWALTLDTSVSSSGFGAVNNLGLLQRQQLLFVAGCATWIVGTVLAVGGALVERIGAPHQHVDHPPEAATARSSFVTVTIVGVIFSAVALLALLVF